MSAPIHVLCPTCDHVTVGWQDATGHVYPEAHQCQENQ